MIRRLPVALLAIFFFTAQFSFGQKTTIRLRKGDIQLRVLIEEIKSQSDVNLIYSPTRIPDRTVTLEKETYNLEQILGVLENAGISVKKERDRYLLVPGPPTLSISNFTLKGYVRDSHTGEALIGANVFISDTDIGVSTNSYGFYSLTLPRGTYDIGTSFVGYEDQTTTLDLSSNKPLNLTLEPRTQQLGSVTISSRPAYYNVQSMVPGINTLDFNTDNHIPYFMGEVDVFQGSLLLPGIRNLGEQASGINVRGGGIDENLILFDEAPIYNPSHYFGLISIFNPESVNDIQFYKGFFPPAYGGRASSVVEVHQKDGNDQEHHVEGGLGLLSARLMAEGPISKGKSSFLVSFRQSLLDPNQLVPAQNEIDTRALFTDVNLKMNWKINERNTLFVSGYFGNDRSSTGFGTDLRWGNRTFTTRWNRQYGRRLFSHFSLVVSEYNYRIREPREAGSFIGKFRVIDYSLKADQSFYVSPKSLISFGAIATLHRLKPGERLPFDPDDTSTNPLELDSEHGLETGVYASHEWTISPKLKILYGFRLSSLLNFGPAQKRIYAPGEPRTDDALVGIDSIPSGKIFDPFLNIEPRISLNWNWQRNSAIKASYNRNYQYIHLISNTVTPNPTDIWKLSDRYLPPTRTDHVSLGLYQNFQDDQWEGYVEAFYKNVDNAIEYRDGADLVFNPAIETELLTARGRAYGLEFYIKKNSGKNKGWISYTLSRVERKIISDFEEDLVNDGAYYPDDNDRPHDLSVVYIRQLTPRLGLSSSFNYSTGRPITLPVAKYTFEGNPIPHFIGRNQSRITDYHRLDFSLRLEGKRVKKNGQMRKYEDYWTFTVYNAYARKNAFSYFFRESEEMPGETEIVRYSVFYTAVPALTYNFRF